MSPTKWTNMSSSYRPSSTSRMDSDLEAALDYLGYNPLEGVPFQLNPAFLPATDLLRRTEALLSRPLPGEERMARGEFAYDSRVERQVIEQLRVADEERERRRREEEAQMEEERERRVREAEERVKREKEQEEARAKEAKEKEEREKKEAEERRLREEQEKKAAEEKALEEEEKRLKELEEAAAKAAAAAVPVTTSANNDPVPANPPTMVSSSSVPAAAPRPAPAGAFPVPSPSVAPPPAAAIVALQQNGPSGPLPVRQPVQQLPQQAVPAGSVGGVLPRLRALSVGQGAQSNSTATRPVVAAANVARPVVAAAPAVAAATTKAAAIRPASPGFGGAAPRSPNPILGQVPPAPAVAPAAIRSAGNPAAKINFSEFEAESDPFESLELKTINDFQALASVLQTSTPSTVPQAASGAPAPQTVQTGVGIRGGAAAVYTSAQQQPGQRMPPFVARGAPPSHLPQHQQMLLQQQQQLQHQRHPMIQQQQQQMVGGRPQQQPVPSTQQQAFRYPAFSPPVYSGYGHQQMPSFVPTTAATRVPQVSGAGVPHARYPAQCSTQLPPNYHPVNNPYGIATAAVPQDNTQTSDSSGGGLKSSKSYGDIVSEMKKEEQMRTLTSVTPPPRAAAVGGQAAARGMEDWVPWPDIGQGATAAKAPTPTLQEPDHMAVLATEAQRQLCRQVHEMGFPLDRVVRTCLALKAAEDPDGGQRIINFCLLVDKVSEALKRDGGGVVVDEKEVEHTLLAKSLEVDPSLRHLRAFRRLKDLGFDSRAIHDALAQCGGDHDKALETLLK